MTGKICLLYTGGTIGMVRGANGYEPKRGVFEPMLQRLFMLHREGMPAFDFYELDPLLDSSNVTQTTWNRIGAFIAEHDCAYDGFVVLHGTDTMAYTASALSFMLEGLQKPVILTGSQIPLCELRSDAENNLASAMLLAAAGELQEVCLYFGGRLLRGNRAVKVTADGLAAFDSPNFPHLATVGVSVFYKQEYLRHPQESVLHLQTLASFPIGVLKVFPGIQLDLFESVMTEKLRGVVLEGFGAGNIPDYDDALLPFVSRALQSDTVVVVCSQCLRGRAELGAYATSARLKEAGAVPGHDMTTESAVAKLYYLFSLGLSTEEVKRLFAVDLRGEMTVVGC